MVVIGSDWFFLQYVVVPTRRSTAAAFQIVLSHCLGDAGSPYLIGVVRAHTHSHSHSHFDWQVSRISIMLICVFVCVCAGI